MQKCIEMILIPLNVFSNYAYRVKISNFYFHFYYGKTSKEDPKNLKVGKNGITLGKLNLMYNLTLPHITRTNQL